MCRPPLFPRTDHGLPSQDCLDPGPFALEVDPEQDWKAKEIKIFSFARPHMRAFHCSWWSQCMANFIWFSIVPLLPAMKDSLGLTSRQIWISNIVAVSSSIVMRSIFGSLTDKYGSRLLMGILLMAISIPAACTGLVNSFAGLCILRFVIGFAGSSFVMCQSWTTRMFANEIVGTANALSAGWGGLGAFNQVIIGTLLFPLFRDVVFTNADDPTEKAWRVVFVIPAIVTFLTGAVIIRKSDDSPRGNYKDLIKERVMRRSSSLSSLREGAIDCNSWLLFIQYGCCFGVELTMFSATAIYFIDRFGLGIGSASAITSIFGILNLFAQALGGYLSDRANRKYGMRGRVWLQLALLVSQGICIILFAFMNSMWSAIAVLLIMSILTISAQGSTFGIVPYVSKSSSGSVVGVVGSGGPSFGVLFGFGFVFFDDIKHAYFLMAGLVIFLGTTSTLLINIRDHGGIFHKPCVPEDKSTQDSLESIIEELYEIEFDIEEAELEGEKTQDSLESVIEFDIEEENRRQNYLGKEADQIEVNNKENEVVN